MITFDPANAMASRVGAEHGLSEADLDVMTRLKRVFGAGEQFNPCKAFPTSKGCGEVHSKVIQAFGPDAYV